MDVKEEYDTITEQATRERKKLDVEIAETSPERQLRLAKGGRDDERKAEVRAMQAAFFCADCQKQYKTVTEMESHLSSYDHHHCKRLRELRQQQKTVYGKPSELKRKREQAEEDKLMQRRIKLAADAAAEAPDKDTAGASAPIADPSVAAEPKHAKVGFRFGSIPMKGAAAAKKKSGIGAKVTSAIPAAFANPFMDSNGQ